ncbi:hypothetical protein [Shewanella mangrovisoli]|uniref:hypothetical protein n=1 Tax=Shewanella mangrovisoli TaxID=2864211 RepID=UPI00370B6AAF
MKLYKYLKNEHMKLLLEKGTLRIGTLHDYNNENKYGAMVSDATDGVKTLRGGGVFFGKEINNHPVISQFFKVADDANNVAINFGSSGRLTVPSRNMFIFSTASKYSTELHEKWHQSEGYDSCYEIFDPDGFFKAISDVIWKSCLYLGYAPVIYTPKGGLNMRSRVANAHPALFKGGEDFGEQCEVRAVWLPKGPVTKIDIDHRIVPIDNVEKYVRKHKIL